MEQILNQLPDALPLGEAHVLVVPLMVDTEQYAELEQSLSADELARANRFIPPEVRRRFVVCRAALRCILARLTGQSASQVAFRYERWGKPQLENGIGGALPHFNVAHSGDWAAIAVAGAPIGVDLEMRPPQFRYRSVASQVLSVSEQAAWEQVPAVERDSEMLRLWVCKESLLKAMGLGIAEGLQQVDFALPIPRTGIFSPLRINSQLQLHLDDDGSCRSNSWIDAGAWQLRMLDLVSGGFAALTSFRSIQQVVVHR